jgi:acyl-CoA thioesterase-1
LIGDSISIGYTLPVRALLKGQANVHRPPTNCGPTIRGLQQIDAWIGEKKWDVIHFNWGLHDLKYMSPKGQKLAKPGAEGSHQQVPPAEYEKNLRRLVARLKQTGATLIWCSTTPVPEGAAGRVVGDSVKYNGIAKKVMEENDVAIDDLYAFSLPKLKEIMRPANVHFTPDGSKQLAKQVVATIRKGLKN